MAKTGGPAGEGFFIAYGIAAKLELTTAAGSSSSEALFVDWFLSMHRSLCLSLSLSGVAALALSNGALLPAAAQNADSAEDLGDVMSISLADVVKPTVGFKGALQGAGTPNQAGIGGFLPLSVGKTAFGSLMQW